jgi:hypothetical protein
MAVARLPVCGVVIEPISVTQYVLRAPSVLSWRIVQLHVIYCGKAFHLITSFWCSCGVYHWSLTWGTEKSYGVCKIEQKILFRDKL